MLTWLGNALRSLGGIIASQFISAFHFVVGGIAGFLDLIFGRVGSAWDDLVSAIKTHEQILLFLTTGIIGQLFKIITVYIPEYAQVAWWWVTHPDELAHVLLWHVLKWLEQEAWTAATYLGEFILALLVRNLRRVLLVLETVVAAIL